MIGVPGICLLLQIATVIVGLGLSLAVYCLRVRRSVRCLLIVVIAFISAIAFLQERATEDLCPHCHSYRFIYTFEIFGLPSTKQVQVSEDIVSQMASDLGCPCAHDWQPRRERVFILFRLLGEDRGQRDIILRDDSYTEDIRALVRELGERDPQLRVEFERRVLREQDFSFIDEVLHRALPTEYLSSVESGTMSTHVARDIVHRPRQGSKQLAGG